MLLLVLATWLTLSIYRAARKACCYLFLHKTPRWKPAASSDIVLVYFGRLRSLVSALGDLVYALFSLDASPRGFTKQHMSDARRLVNSLIITILAHFMHMVKSTGYPTKGHFPQNHAATDQTFKQQRVTIPSSSCVANVMVAEVV